MNRLSYDTLEKIGYDGYLLREAPERVLQFGEGNFLRGFVDRYIDVANETRGFDGKVCVVQPRAAHPAVADALNAQDGLYTVYVRGQVDGVPVETCRVVSAISRVLNPHREEDYAALMELAVSDDLELVVSNTTDAGIAWDGSCGPDDRPPASYPAKLAQLLHVRWLTGKPGVTVLPCELIPENGERLLELVTRHARGWGWEDAFVDWLSEGCTFATTLVDSIVPGSVTDPVESAAMDEAAGYEDGFKLVREVFELWGVQGPAALAETLPFADSPSVFVTDDVAPYERRKVRVLNGAHTGFALGAYLSGLDIVRDCMHDASVCAFMDGLLEEEVIPTLLPALDRDDCLSFARATKERFDNPFVDHRLISISLNSVAKWRGRVMPTLLDAVEAAGVAPWRLATTLAFLIAFYTSDPTGIDDGGLSLTRPDDTVYHADDAPEVLEFFLAHAGDGTADLVAATLAQEAFWGRDLNDVPGLADRVTEQLALIREQGCRAAMDACATKGGE